MPDTTNPKSTHIVWADFGADAQTVVDRLDAVTDWLNANRPGGMPKYRRADGLRTVLLRGLEACEALMAQAEDEEIQREYPNTGGDRG